MRTQVDVLVIGAGPAGSSAARAAASGGLRVLLVERRPTVGLPVQCAEYVPAQLVHYISIPERCIARRVRAMHTHLPDGQVVETPACGYMLDRALFDRALAVAACQAGAELWTAAPAVTVLPGENLAYVRRGGRLEEVGYRILIGADGPRSLVGKRIGQVNAEFVHAVQVEVALNGGRDHTEVYFDSVYRGGYGWFFPKENTANVGVGVNCGMGGEPRRALAHLLERLNLGSAAIVGHTAGLIPVGGVVGQMRVGNVLLAGDAAGHTHPITGAGVFAAVVGGILAGEMSVKALRNGDLELLEEYEREWSAFMGGPLRHALSKRCYRDERWSDHPVALSRLIRETWVAFPDYARRTPSEVTHPCR
ncbi:MAG: NAD(P)/FAD-dependent oxidoreductase [Anaerolineae bacterium]|nr:NAD(P)/FAD-dependent oxidoreductase [Anaerolineae bacterium]